MTVFTASRSRGGGGSSRPFYGLLTPRNHRIVTLSILLEIHTFTFTNLFPAWWFPDLNTPELWKIVEVWITAETTCATAALHKNFQ